MNLGIMGGGSLIIRVILLTISFSSVTSAQTIVKASYELGTIQFEVSNRQTTDTYKVYLDGASQVRTATCAANICQMALPDLKLGNNILELTAIRNGAESIKSNPVIIFYGIKEDLLSIKPVKCKQGTYTMERITISENLLGAVNRAKYLAYMFSTSNAIYVFGCDLE